MIATHSLGDLVGTAGLLGTQRCRWGPGLAIVFNAGDAGVLAADACGDAGLTIATLGERSPSSTSTP